MKHSERFLLPSIRFKKETIHIQTQIIFKPIGFLAR